MLITIIGDIFTNVSGKLKNNQLKELTQLMLDNDWLFDLFSFFKKVKYVIVFNKEQGEKEEENDESRFSNLKNHIKKNTSKERLDSIHKRTVDFLSKKIENRSKYLATSNLV